MKNFPANITIRYANPQDGPRIDVYYAGYRHGPLFAASQTVVLAEAKDTIIGVVRLCEERGYALLRTMRVDEPYQGQGIGKRLLEAFPAAHSLFVWTNNRLILLLSILIINSGVGQPLAAD